MLLVLGLHDADGDPLGVCEHGEFTRSGNGCFGNENLAAHFGDPGEGAIDVRHGEVNVHAGTQAIGWARENSSGGLLPRMYERVTGHRLVIKGPVEKCAVKIAAFGRVSGHQFEVA